MGNFGIDTGDDVRAIKQVEEALKSLADKFATIPNSFGNSLESLTAKVVANSNAIGNAYAKAMQRAVLEVDVGVEKIKAKYSKAPVKISALVEVTEQNKTAPKTVNAPVVKGSDITKLEAYSTAWEILNTSIAQVNRSLTTYLALKGKLGKSPTVILPANTVNTVTTQLEKVSSKVNETKEDISKGFKTIYNIGMYYLVHRLVYNIIARLQQAREEWSKFEIAVSEIRTISQNEQLPFENWARQLRKISDDTGIILGDVTKATYQAVSNQVGQGQVAIDFMKEAAKFALTTSSTMEQSVDLLTAALNSFNLGAEYTSQVAASLFKTIELGRVTAKEFSNDIGRLYVPANQLGISIEEINAAIATATISGQKYSTVATQLRNILVKMISPTQELAKLNAQLGFNSAKQAIDALGFTGYLQKLNEEINKMGEVGRAEERMFELVNTIRGLAGMMSITGKNMDEYNKSLGLMNNATTSYLQAQQIAMESWGKQWQIQTNQVSNLFVEMSGNVNKFILGIANQFGGLRPMLETFISLGLKIGEILASWYISKAIIASVYSLATAYMALGKSIKFTTLAAKGLKGALTFGLAFGVDYAISKLIGEIEKAGDDLITLNAIYDNNSVKATILAGRMDKLTTAFKIQSDSIVELSRASLKPLAAKAIELNQALAIVQTKIGEGVRMIRKQLADTVSYMERKLNLVNRAAEKLRTSLVETATTISKIRFGDFESTLSKLTDTLFNYSDIEKTLSGYSKLTDFTNRWNYSVDELAERYKSLYRDIDLSISKGGVVITREAKRERERFSKELLELAARRQSYDKYVAVTEKMLQGAITVKDEDRVQNIYKELFDLNIKGLDVGYDINEVLKNRDVLLARLLAYEEQTYQAKLKQKEAVEAEQIKVQETLDALKQVQKELSSVDATQRSSKETKARIQKAVEELQIKANVIKNPEIAGLVAQVLSDTQLDQNFQDLGSRIDLDFKNLERNPAFTNLTNAVNNVVEAIGIQSKIMDDIKENDIRRTKIAEESALNAKMINDYGALVRNAEETSQATIDELKNKLLDVFKNLKSSESNPWLTKDQSIPGFAGFSEVARQIQVEKIGPAFSNSLQEQLELILAQLAKGFSVSTAPSLRLALDQIAKQVVDTAVTPESKKTKDELITSLGEIIKALDIFYINSVEASDAAKIFKANMKDIDKVRFTEAIPTVQKVTVPDVLDNTIKSSTEILSDIIKTTTEQNTKHLQAIQNSTDPRTVANSIKEGMLKHDTAVRSQNVMKDYDKSNNLARTLFKDAFKQFDRTWLTNTENILDGFKTTVRGGLWDSSLTEKPARIVQNSRTKLLENRMNTINNEQEASRQNIAGAVIQGLASATINLASAVNLEKGVQLVVEDARGLASVIASHVMVMVNKGQLPIQTTAPLTNNKK